MAVPTKVKDSRPGDRWRDSRSTGVTAGDISAETRRGRRAAGQGRYRQTPHRFSGQTPVGSWAPILVLPSRRGKGSHQGAGLNSTSRPSPLRCAICDSALSPDPQGAPLTLCPSQAKATFPEEPYANHESKPGARPPPPCPPQPAFRSLCQHIKSSQTLGSDGIHNTEQ